MKRLTGQERFDFERQVLAGVKRSRRLVLREILEFAGGKPVCWPSNARLGERVGLKNRAIQYILRDLEAERAILTINDASGRRERLIVILGHPGAREAVQGFASPRAKNCMPRMQELAPYPVQAAAPEAIDLNPGEEPRGGVPASGPAAPEEKSPAFDRLFGRLRFDAEGNLL